MRKVLTGLGLAFVSTVVLGVTAYAGEWLNVSGNWYYRDDFGNNVTNQWIGNYYLGSDGVMLTNTWTPDGYYVGADGAWTGESSATDNQNTLTQDETISDGVYNYVLVGTCNNDMDGFRFCIFAGEGGYTAWTIEDIENDKFKYLASIGNVNAIMDSSGYDTSVKWDTDGYWTYYHGDNGKEVAEIWIPIYPKRTQVTYSNGFSKTYNYSPEIKDGSTLFENVGGTRDTNGTEIKMIEHYGSSTEYVPVTCDETSSDGTMYNVYFSFGPYMEGNQTASVLIKSSEGEFYVKDVYSIDSPDRQYGPYYYEPVRG